MLRNDHAHRLTHVHVIHRCTNTNAISSIHPRYSLQEDDLLEWDSYSPPVCDNLRQDDDDDDDRGSGGVGGGVGGGGAQLRPFSSSSCGVISDTFRWPLRCLPQLVRVSV